ncbi:MAG: hypothetical protein U9N02_03875 [Campylobacterota bacterium]|nr:hypothetical protein [Campylobacterota bacterium]
MAYILGIIIVSLLFLSLHYFTELNKKQKSIISIVVLLIILSAIAFNTYSTSQREKMLNAVTKFNQHKTIQCKGISVNDKNFTISIGTYTFIGKKDSENFGQMISASECE